MSKIKVSGIELTTQAGVKVPLTLEEAKDLYQQLGKLFSKPAPIVMGPTIIERYPVNISPACPPYTPPGWPMIICSNNAASAPVNSSMTWNGNSGLMMTYSGESAA